MSVHKYAPWSGFAGRSLTVAVLIGAVGLRAVFMNALRGPKHRRAFTTIWIVGFAIVAVVKVYGEPEVPISPEYLQNHLEQTQAVIGKLITGDDVLDSLHFAWSDRPYTRATLAVLVKSSSVLKRELRLRRMGNGALPDETARAMLHWQLDALARTAISPPDHPGFRPHRLRVSDARLDRLSGTPSLFGVIDAAMVTRHNDVVGDLDLIAALGFRVYGWTGSRLYSADDRLIQCQRAHALGMAVVRLAPEEGGDQAGSTAPSENVLTIEPAALADLVAGRSARPNEPGAPVAISDPPYGESWASRIARRALARGSSSHRRFITCGWMAPGGGPSRDPRAIQSAVWLDAIEGQSLGLVRGWRDLRDGSASQYASVLQYPERIEAVALAALDLIRLGRGMASLRSTPLLAIAVDGAAVDPSDTNAWASWVEPVWAALWQHQIPYDLISSGEDRDKIHRDYRMVEFLRPDSAQDAEALVASWDKRLADFAEHVNRVTGWEPNGAMASDIVVRMGSVADKESWLMIANVSARGRRVQLRPFGAVKQMRDLITGEDLSAGAREVPLGPWQVCVLSAAQ